MESVPAGRTALPAGLTARRYGSADGTGLVRAKRVRHRLVGVAPLAPSLAPKAGPAGEVASKCPNPEPGAGIEPATIRLQGGRSAD
jgi:hypothetical protein